MVSTASAIVSARAAKASSELPPSGKTHPRPPPPPTGKPGVEEVAILSISLVQMDSTHSPATTTADTGVPSKPGVVVGSSELRTCLITLLTENPKGMTLKVGIL